MLHIPDINFVYEFYMLHVYTNTSDNIPANIIDDFDFQVLSVNCVICVSVSSFVRGNLAGSSETSFFRT